MLKNNKRFLPKLIKYKKYSEKGGYLIPFENVKKRIALGNNCPIKIKRIFFLLQKKMHLEEIMLTNYVLNFYFV